MSIPSRVRRNALSVLWWIDSTLDHDKLTLDNSWHRDKLWSTMTNVWGSLCPSTNKRTPGKVKVICVCDFKTLYLDIYFRRRCILFPTCGHIFWVIIISIKMNISVIPAEWICIILSPQYSQEIPKLQYTNLIELSKLYIVMKSYATQTIGTNLMILFLEIHVP